MGFQNPIIIQVLEVKIYTDNYKNKLKNTGKPSQIFKKRTLFTH